MTKRRNYENGQAIVLIAFAFIAFVAMAGLAIDGGMVYSDRRHAQNAADAGSLAAGGAAALTMENNHIFYSPLCQERRTCLFDSFPSRG